MEKEIGKQVEERERKIREFNPKKQIKDVDDFNEYAIEMFENYLEDFTEANGLIRDVEEGDMCDEGIEFVYTQKGMRLAEKFLDKLYEVGSLHFPNEDIEINSHLFRDL